MKRIEAHVKPFRLEEVRSALAGLGLHDLAITEIHTCGRPVGVSGRFRDKDCASEFRSKIKLEVVVSDALAGAASAAIVEAARTGSLDDGNVFVVHLDEAIPIRAPQADQFAAP